MAVTAAALRPELLFRLQTLHLQEQVHARSPQIYCLAPAFCILPEILPPGNFAWFSSVLVKLAVQHPQDAQISHLLPYSGSMLAPELDVLCGPRRRSFRLSLHIPTLPQN